MHYLVIIQLGWGFEVSTTYATAVHILWFAFLRFMSLQWPFLFKPFAEKYGKVSEELIPRAKHCVAGGKRLKLENESLSEF